MLIANLKNGVCQIPLEQQDATHFDHQDQFDFITAFDAIHDQANPEIVLENIRRSIKTEGIFLMQGIAGSSKLESNMSHSLAPYLYTISCLHCMTVSLALNGKGLGANGERKKQLKC